EEGQAPGRVSERPRRHVPPTERGRASLRGRNEARDRVDRSGRDRTRRPGRGSIRRNGCHARGSRPFRRAPSLPAWRNHTVDGKRSARVPSAIMLTLRDYPLEALASEVGTPFYLYDGAVLRETMRRFAEIAVRPGFAGRYAMKANSARPILAAAREEGLWIDAVSGNEGLRAIRAGFPGGSSPPETLLATDVFRDNALETILENRVLPNLGSPGMLRYLREAGYHGPIGIRANPGFGQGHTESCDTGGPSSKHGIWPDRLEAVRSEASRAGLPVTVLHAHVGTGPEVDEFDRNVRTLVEFFAELLPQFPAADAVSLGGGIPHPYRPGEAAYGLEALRPTLDEAGSKLGAAAGRPIR